MIKHILKRASLWIGIILIVGMLIVISLNRAAIYDELVAFDLIPQPEKLTELYFNKNADLPVSATSQQEIHFTFVIHNLEAADYQYIYVVFVNAGVTRQIIDRGRVLVKNNQYYVKGEQFYLAQVVGRQNIIVELTNKRQSIDFWIEK